MVLADTLQIWLALKTVNTSSIGTLLSVLVVVKKTLRYSNGFFYNRTIVYAPIPYFGIFQLL
jgi:hypothetical protein